MRFHVAKHQADAFSPRVNDHRRPFKKFVLVQNLHLKMLLLLQWEGNFEETTAQAQFRHTRGHGFPRAFQNHFSPSTEWEPQTTRLSAHKKRITSGQFLRITTS